MKKLTFLLALLLSVTLLTGCNKQDDSQKDDSQQEQVTELSTVITDSTALDLSMFDGTYAEKNFTKDGIGPVKLVRHVDGDTTWFKDLSGEEFSLRYDGINTPESTRKVQPWGHEASNFTKGQINKATEIVLQNTSDEQKTGDRYLGLVWLKDADHQDFYCLNLLLVEQAYSKNLLFDKKSPYLDAFIQAGKNAEMTGKRVYGENDPDYDYSNKVLNVTVNDIYDNFADYEKHTKKLRLQAVVTRIEPDGFYVSSIRDEDSEEPQEIRYIYAYTMGDNFGPNVTIGTIIEFYCSAGYYGEKKQLTNVDTSTYGSTKLVVHGQTIVDEIVVDEKTNLEDPTLLYAPIKASLEVTGEIRFSEKSQDGTLPCKFIGSDKKFNLRIPSIYAYKYEKLTIGTQLTATGILDSYRFNEKQDFEYQLKVCDPKVKNGIDYEIIE